ncbi:MAG: lipopolysaccharide heptosyltransferase II [Planctomycetes bacterium]|nr:lipopolysaccharide heptosyltransferase II [Planctomycetota bacterium]
MTCKENILVWLPSPMGDTILATGVLRALRAHFAQAGITYYGSPVTRQLLTPCAWHDDWLEQEPTLKAVSHVRQRGFTRVILLKNSFGSALTCFLAGIPVRIGYARDRRSWLLTHRIKPAKLPNGTFKARSMVDYYSDLCASLGIQCKDRMPALEVSPDDRNTVKRQFACLADTAGPLVILVPGGAFGPSKCWAAASYARLADTLYESRKARIIVSVSPNESERAISRDIVRQSNCPVTDLGETPVTLGELKALFEQANLVISNDTGPRHVAIALQRRVITLFGPNDPKWTDTGYAHETQIMAPSDCVCCQKPVCKQPDQHCMDTITVDSVHAAALQSLNRPCP